jgi:hypothetical protein
MDSLYTYPTKRQLYEVGRREHTLGPVLRVHEAKKMGVRSAQDRNAVKIYYFLSTNTSVARGGWELRENYYFCEEGR